MECGKCGYSCGTDAAWKRHLRQTDEEGHFKIPLELTVPKSKLERGLQKNVLHFSHQENLKRRDLRNLLVFMSEKGVRHLNISWSYIRNRGVKFLAYSQKSGRCPLETLNLSVNGIGDDGAIAIAEARITDRTLVSLSLEGNYIGDEGAIALAKVIRFNNTLI